MGPSRLEKTKQMVGVPRTRISNQGPLTRPFEVPSTDLVARQRTQQQPADIRSTVLASTYGRSDLVVRGSLATSGTRIRGLSGPEKHS